jgi:hypothetical protein
MKKLVIIVDTTDKKHRGKSARTDLYTIEIESGETFDITGRAHLGNGEWQVWNSNYVLTIREIIL